MKKNYFVLGLMSMILSLTACTKEGVDNSVATPEQNMISHSIAISEEGWSEDVRSSYEPGVGITLEGTEDVTVYYSEVGSSVLSNYVKGENDNNTITFSHEGNSEAYDYYFFMPHLATSKKNSKGSASYHRIGVQFPKSNTFDPNYDFMAGTPALNVASTEMSAGITGFKRLMAPIHLTVKDLGEVLGEEKIQQVTLSFDAETSTKCYLSGLFYFRHSENYADAEESGAEVGSICNAVTADYPGGLTRNSEGNWDVWFMAHPATLPSCNMTLTVTTDNYRITRTVATGKEIVFTDKMINTLSFNVSGANHAISDSYTVDFSSITKAPSSIFATNGSEYDWTLSGLTYDSKVAPLPNSLRFKNSTYSGLITLPKLPDGAFYKGIYITQNANNTTKDAIISVKDGDEVIASGNFSYYGDVSKQGGVLALTFEPVQGPISLSHECGDALWVTRISVETSGDIGDDLDTNDYWAMYHAGMDIQVGDLTINKKDYPDAKLVCMDSAESEDKIRTSILQKGGLIFLDTYTNEDGSEAEDQVLTLTNNYQPAAETIIIGRWINKQSKIECATYTSNDKETGTYFAIDKVVSGGVAFKNLEWVGNALTTQLLVRGGNIGNDIDYFIVEDCTMTAYQHLYRYSNTTKNYVIKKSIFRNNIIKMLGTADNYNVASISKDNTNFVDYDKYDKIDLIEFTNNVIICPESVAAGKRRMLIDYGSTGAGFLFDMTKMAIVVKNNTFYNLHASKNIMIRAFRCGSALIEGNLAYVDGTDPAKVTANCYLFGLYAHNDGTTAVNTDLQTTEEALYRVVNNFAASYNMTATNSNSSNTVQNGWTFLYKDGQPVYYYDNNNKSSFKSATANHVFTKVNFETGYLPVNTTEVNNGAGASYETKLWRIWE